MKQLITFLGPPGAGKDTQANRLAKDFNFYKFSLGDTLKKQSTNNPYLQKIIKDGLLVPDSVINQVILKEISKTKKRKILVSGFPRTLIQAEFAIKEFHKHNINLKAVILLDLSPETAIERLSGRLVCPKCGRIYHPKYIPPKKPGVCDFDGAKLRKRVEDTPKTILLRLKQYKKLIGPVLNILEKYHLLIKVNGDYTPEEVYYHLLNSLKKRKILDIEDVKCIQKD